MIGTVRMTEPAISTVVGTSMLPASWERPSETVQFSRFSTRKSRAKRNSFHAIMKTNSAFDAMAGMASGRLIVPHRLEAGAAVDGRGLLEAGRDRVEVVAQHVDRDRGHLGDVDDEQAGQGAALADPGEEHEQRDRQQDRREEVDPQEDRADLAPAEELEPADGVRARDRRRAGSATTVPTATNMLFLMKLRKPWPPSSVEASTSL